MYDGGCRNEDPHRHSDGDIRHQRISVESRQKRPRRSECNCQHQPGPGVDPEQIAGCLMVDFFKLDNRLGKSIEAKAHQKEAEGGHHGDDAEVGWRQQASQNHSADHLGRESQTRSRYCCRGSANGKAP